MARRRRHEEHENHERWLVSYADMITVLMALFIVLFAMSTIDETKFWELRASLANSFGHELAAVQGGKSPTPGDSTPEGPLAAGVGAESGSGVNGNPHRVCGWSTSWCAASNV